MTKAFFVVSATVSNSSERTAFDEWYSKEHAPLAIKLLGARKAVRFWNRNKPEQHVATYEFSDQETLMKAVKSPQMKELSVHFDTTWGDIPRIGDIMLQVETLTAASS